MKTYNNMSNESDKPAQVFLQSKVTIDLQIQFNNRFLWVILHAGGGDILVTGSRDYDFYGSQNLQVYLCFVASICTEFVD